MHYHKNAFFNLNRNFQKQKNYKIKKKYTLNFGISKLDFPFLKNSPKQKKVCTNRNRRMTERGKTHTVDLKSILRRLRDIRKQTNELLKRKISDMDLIAFQYTSAVQIGRKTQDYCLKSIMKENASYEQNDLDKLRNALQYFTAACRYRDVVADLKRNFPYRTLRNCETDTKNGFSWEQQRNEHNASYIISNLIRRRCRERKRGAAVLIQSRYRTYITKLAYKIELETKRNAARIIQHAFREMRANVRDDAARIVQRYFRHVTFINQRWKCARRIQATWRCVTERRRFRNQYEACMKLQITWRRRYCEQRRLMSVRKIQRATRMFLRRRADVRAERARRRQARRMIGRWLLRMRTKTQQNRASSTLVRFFRRSRRRVSRKNPAIDEDEDDKVDTDEQLYRQRRRRSRKRKKRKSKKKKRRETYELPPLISNRRKSLDDENDSTVLLVSRPPLGKLRVPPGQRRRMLRRK